MFIRISQKYYFFDLCFLTVFLFSHFAIWVLIPSISNDNHLDGLIQEIIKIVDTQKAEIEKETKEKTKKEITKKVKPKK